MQGEIAQMELLAQFQMLHVVEDGPFDGLRQLDGFLFIEIHAMGRLGDFVRFREIGLGARDGSFHRRRRQVRKFHELFLEFLRNVRRLDLELDQVVGQNREDMVETLEQTHDVSPVTSQRTPGIEAVLDLAPQGAGLPFEFRHG